MPSFFLGIDASKGYADFVLLDECERLLEPAFQLDDTFTGHSRLYQILRRFSVASPEAVIHAAAESTGGYETNWLAALGRFQASLPLKRARLNPSLVRRHAQARGLRTTTDATSAEAIASFLIAHPKKVRYDEDDALASLRTQVSFIEQLVKQRTALLGQFEKLLYRAHPQLMPYLTSGVPAWVLKLVRQYPTAPRLARARPRTVGRIPYVSPARAQALIAAAQHSVASATDAASEQLLRAMARQLLELGQVIKTQQQALTEQVDLPEEVALLKSFGSISAYSAVRLLLEIQAVERFATAKKMASFFGVHPVFKQSGDGIGAMRMSKQGSSRMRALLFMITLNAIQHNPVIAPLYARMLAEGKQKMVAVGISMHKTLRILYGLLKHRRPFDPEIDRRHRAQRRAEQPSAAYERKRRYQPYDASAPVSRRAKKRRQPQKDSQGAVGTACGMTTPAAASLGQRGEHATSSIKEQANSP